MKEIAIALQIEEESGANTVNILCINSIAAKMEVVRANRLEEAFAGDEFQGYIVFSGKAVCKFLKSW